MVNLREPLPYSGEALVLNTWTRYTPHNAGGPGRVLHDVACTYLTPELLAAAENERVPLVLLPLLFEADPDGRVLQFCSRCLVRAAGKE